MWGGELFVPKIPSYKILDVAKAIAPNCKYEIVGIRPGEKLHEEMITGSDSQNTIDLGPYYAILPTADNSLMEQYLSNKGAKRVAEGFSYSSGTNEHFLSVEEIRDLISRHVDENFLVL